MAQKVINKVKQFSDSEELKFGELMIDIDAQDPSITFIGEEYKDVKIRPVKDVSKEVEQLMVDMELKASKESLDATNLKLTETTNKVTSLENDLDLTKKSVSSIQTQVEGNKGDIEALNELLTYQTTELSKLGGVTSDISQNASAIDMLHQNLMGVSSTVNKHTKALQAFDEDFSDAEKDIALIQNDIQTLGSAVNSINTALKKTYRVRGTATPTNLNGLGETARAEGDVYNISKAGVLNDGPEENGTATSVKVRKGDNVVWVATSSTTGYWDTLMATVDVPEDNYVNVIDGPQASGKAYTMNWLSYQTGEPNNQNKVSYHLVTAKGHKSMDEDEGNSRTYLPSYNRTTKTQDWLGGFFLIDGDVNMRGAGSWQKAYNLLTGDEYLRFYCTTEAGGDNKSWTAWRKTITTDDINVNQLSSSFTNRTVIGALNELKSNANSGSSTPTTTVQQMGLKVERTDSNNIVSMTPDGSNSYTIKANGDNDACEDNLYMVVHGGESNVLNLGIKKNAYLQKNNSELTNTFVVADHKATSSGVALDDNDKLKIEVGSNNTVKFSLSRLADNPITVIDSNYDFDNGLKSLNWVSTSTDGQGKVKFYMIMPSAIEKLKSNYPKEFTEGCLLMNWDIANSSRGELNNGHGTLQVAISMGIQTTADGKPLLAGRKAYRMRFSSPTEENPNALTWSNWVYEELSDKIIDNEVNVLTTKDLKWLGPSHNHDYRNAVSYYYIAPENYGNISDDGGMLSKAEFEGGVWVINYDVDGKRKGTFQQMIGIKTGETATRMIYTVDTNGAGLYSSWKLNTVDLTPYQTSSITPISIYKANKAATVVAAFSEINSALSTIYNTLDNKFSQYQKTVVSISGLSKRTVETCLAELAGKVKTLESTVAAGSDIPEIEPYVDERIFKFKIKNSAGSLKDIPFAAFSTGSDDTTFGIMMEVTDFYNGKQCKNGQVYKGTALAEGEEPSSKIIELDEINGGGSMKNGVRVKLNTDYLLDNAMDYSGIKDGFSYVNLFNATTYGNFIDFSTDDNLLWCVDDGAYHGLGSNPSQEQIAAAAQGWSLTTSRDISYRLAKITGSSTNKPSLATIKQADKLIYDYNYGFKIKTISNVKYLYLTKNGSSIYRIGKWNIESGAQLGFWLEDGCLIVGYNGSGVLVWRTENHYPDEMRCAATGALFVLDKTNLGMSLVAHNSHNSIHLNEGDKYKLQNFDSIIEDKMYSALEVLVPIGTIIPFMPYKDKTSFDTSLTFTNTSMLVENGGNWAVCDGQNHGGYATPNLCGKAPVGVNGYSSEPNSLSWVSHTHTIYYKSTKAHDGNAGSLTPNGNRKGELFLGNSTFDMKKIMNYNDNNTGESGDFDLSTSITDTPGRYTWYLIRVR